MKKFNFLFPLALVASASLVVFIPAMASGKVTTKSSSKYSKVENEENENNIENDQKLDIVDKAFRATSQSRLSKEYLSSFNLTLEARLKELKDLVDLNVKQKESFVNFDALMKLLIFRLERKESLLPLSIVELIENNFYDSKIIFEKLINHFEKRDEFLKLKGELDGIRDAKLILKSRILNFQKLELALKEYLHSQTKIFSLKFNINEIEKIREIRRDSDVDLDVHKEAEEDIIRSIQTLNFSIDEERKNIFLKRQELLKLLDELSAQKGLTDFEELILVSVRDGIGSVIDEDILLREDLINWFTQRAYLRVAQRLADYYANEYRFNFATPSFNLFGLFSDAGVMLNRRAELPANEFFLRMFAQQIAGAVKHGSWFNKLHPAFLKQTDNKQGWTFLCKSRDGQNSNSSPSTSSTSSYDLTDTSKAADDIKPDRHFTPLSKAKSKATSKGTGGGGGSGTKASKSKDDCPQHGLYDSLVKWLFWSIPDLNYQTSFTKDNNLVYINYALSNPDSYCQFFNLSFNIFTFKINN